MVDSSSSDGLSLVLSNARLQGTAFNRGALRGPWGVKSAGLPQVICITLVRGKAVFMSRSSVFDVAKGDVVLIRPNTTFSLRDERSSPAIPFERFVKTIGTRRTGPESHLVCGALDLDVVAEGLVTTSLPPVLWLRASHASAAHRAIVNALTAEVTEPGPGTPLMVTRLAELLFFRALRTCVDRHAGQRWLRGLADPQLSKVLTAIHLAPERDWNLEALAAIAGMSRSSFAEVFKKKVGDTPQAFLIDSRMRHAARLLKTTSLAPKEVAAKVGYGSDESFARAFRRWSGTTPGRYRQSDASSAVTARP